MYRLLSRFFDICLLRAGPQDLPASGFLLGMALAAYFVLDFIAFSLVESPPQALMKSVLDLALFMGLTWAVLRGYGAGGRFTQTATALLGTGVLIGAVSLPVIGWLVRLQAEQAMEALPVLLWFMLLFWSIVVVAHILRHALSVSYAMGILYAVIYLLISITLVNGASQAPV